MEFLQEEGIIVPKIRDHGKTALIYKDTHISYSELIENVESYANLLDILPGEHVAIVMENRPQWVYAFYAVWQRGGVVIPIDYMSTPEEIAYVLMDSTPSFVFCSEETKEKVERAVALLEKKLKVYNVDRIIPPKRITHYMHRDIHDLALILYTSGTTGYPKGVMLSFKNLLSNIRAVEKLGIVGKDDTTVALLPFHHAYPLMTTLLIPIHIGATVVFLEKLSSEALIQTMQKYGVTVLVGVPRLYQLLHKKIEEKISSNPIASTIYNVFKRFPRSIRRLVFRRVHKSFGGRLRFMVSGGAKLPLDTAKFLDSLGFYVLEGYGLTETSPIVSFNPPNRIKLGSVGIPIEEVNVRIEEDGEVLVRGPNVMMGYYNKPEETEGVFKNGWLMTGDLGYLDEEGYLYIQGRKKEIIVLPGGKNVNPEEIEQEILKIDPLVKEVGILEVEGSLKALVYPDENVVREKKILNLKEYIKWNVLDRVNLSLPPWKRITGFKIVTQELPKTRLGKLKRYKLQELYYQQTRETSGETRALNTPTALALREFIEKSFNKTALGYEHIELDLGLDSLEKVELLSFIEKTFGISMSEEELSNYMTLDKLVDFIEKRGEKTEFVELHWSTILKEGKPYMLKEWKLTFSIGRLFIKLFFKLYNRLEVHGQEKIPQGPCILAPNHASYLDGFVMACALPYGHSVNTYFLGEESYFRGRIRSLFGSMAHVITVNLNRNLKESLQKTAWALRLGKKVVIFPEGARTRDGNLLSYKKGFAILSKELSVPVVPVLLLGTYESMSIRDRFPKPKKIRVFFLDTVYPQEKSYEEIVKEVREKTERALIELRRGKRAP